MNATEHLYYYRSGSPGTGQPAAPQTLPPVLTFRALGRIYSPSLFLSRQLIVTAHREVKGFFTSLKQRGCVRGCVCMCTLCGCVVWCVTQVYHRSQN